MDEMLRIKEDSYELYEELLLQRDNLEREAASIRICYLQEFGDLITDSFRLKVECIKKKKIISYCQQAINKGEKIDVQAIEETISKEMDIYYSELAKILSEYDDARNAETVSAGEANRAKKIYRRIAKRIHPDTFPLTMKNERLQELWERTVAAYHALDSDELEDIEALINKYLKDVGEIYLVMYIPDIEERLARLEKEIIEITTTEPYIFAELLDDEVAVEEKKCELIEEIHEYEKYTEELSNILSNLLAKGGASITWKMD